MKISYLLFIAVNWCFVVLQGSYALASTEVNLATGYRQDELKWSIAGFNDRPNILSELKWKQLQIWQVQLSGRSLEFCSFYARYSVSYGKIFDGKTQDADYFGDNRTEEFSRCYADASRGEVFDTSVCIGYMLRFPCGLNIAPVVGNSYHMQNLHMYDGKQVVNTLSNFLGKIRGLNSKYKSRWESPWIGTDVVWQIQSDWSFLGTFEYHWAKYHAKGRWNLRSQFLDDFKHKANGSGIVIRMGVVCQLTPHLFFNVMLASQNWSTRAGSDRTKILQPLKLPNNEFIRAPVEYKTKLNAVKWNSYEMMVGIACCF